MLILIKYISKVINFYNTKYQINLIRIIMRSTFIIYTRGIMDVNIFTIYLIKFFVIFNRFNFG
jgi:hypothetical protein